VSLRARLLVSTAGPCSPSRCSSPARLVVGLTRQSLVDQLDASCAARRRPDLAAGARAGSHRMTRPAGASRCSCIAPTAPSSGRCTSGFASECPDPAARPARLGGGIRGAPSQPDRDARPRTGRLVPRAAAAGTCATGLHPRARRADDRRRLTRWRRSSGTCSSSAASRSRVVLLVGWLSSGATCARSSRSATAAERIAAGDLRGAWASRTTAPRSAGSGTPSTRCSTRSRPRSRSSAPRWRPRSAASAGCASSWPTPRTSCARRSRRCAATPSCTAPAAWRRTALEQAMAGSAPRAGAWAAGRGPAAPRAARPGPPAAPRPGPDLSASSSRTPSPTLRAVEPERPVDRRSRPGSVVIGDEDRLRQVIGNLLANVRVHTPVDARSR
jgi:hypothetical protein